MRHGMSKPRGLKVRGCADSLINLNKYLYVFPGENISEKRCVIEIHGILLNSMPNIWSKQAYVQGFDSESITLKEAVKFFECMKNQNIFMKV